MDPPIGKCSSGIKEKQIQFLKLSSFSALSNFEVPYFNYGMFLLKESGCETAKQRMKASHPS